MRRTARLLRGDEPRQDPVRVQAYEHARQVLAGRRCATSNLTDAQLAALQSDPSPETVGRPENVTRHR